MLLDQHDGGISILVHLDTRRRREVDDLRLPETARLEERVRARAASMLRESVAAVDEAIRAAVASAPVENNGSRSEDLFDPAGDVCAIVSRTVGADTAAEFIHAARQERLGGLLRAGERGADTRDRGGGWKGQAAVILRDLEAVARFPRLPVALHCALAWHVAAAIRVHAGHGGDAALVAATRRVVAERRAVEGRADVANRLAAQGTAEVPDVLLQALHSAELTLFMVLLARGAAMDYETARMLTLDPSNLLFWAATRDAAMPLASSRSAAALLISSDPALDADTVVDALERAYALDSAELDRALAPLRLPRELRAAAILVGGP